MQQDQMERIYRNTPWTRSPGMRKRRPPALVELVESGTLRPCKAIDLGCSAGNYAVYLAGLGFAVTGADISPAAMEHARENASEKSASCDFQILDVLGNLDHLEEAFDFAYDYEFLHHLFPEKRKR